MNIVYNQDNLIGLKALADNSVDAIITDSPYGLGKAPDPLKVLPDWLSKGYHEVNGKGFMGKEWDAFVPQPVTWKECFRVLKPGGYLLSFFSTRTHDWGTMAIRLAGFEIRDTIMWVYGSGFPKSKSNLKPAVEPICVARKHGPLSNLNIDDCRISTDWSNDPNHRPNGKKPSQTLNCYGKDTRTEHWHQTQGRFPSNVCIDEETAILIDNQSGISGGDKRKSKRGKLNVGTESVYGNFTKGTEGPCYQDKGGASRFFYVAKASPSERKGIKHPTVKPIKLMDQLIKLYSSEGDLVLDPYAGSGTTLVSCIRNNRKYIGFEKEEPSYLECLARISKAENEKGLFN